MQRWNKQINERTDKKKKHKIFKGRKQCSIISGFFHTYAHSYLEKRRKLRWFVFLKTTSLYKNTYGNAMVTGSLWAYRIKVKLNLEGSDRDLAETVLDFINWIVI